MGQQPKELTPHESLHHYWGAELRALRTARGLSLAELGQQVHCNPSYLAKIERAERPIPATLVESCDRALDASGTLMRLHALAEAEHEQATEPTHVASEDIHVTNQPGNLDGEIVVPARTPDGRVVFVSVPRRAFLQGIGSTALGIAATSIPALPKVGDVHPIEHFDQMLQVLVDNDKLFGARRVIPFVREQIAIMQQLRSSWHGPDQRALIGVEARFAEFCGWLYRDTGEHHLAGACADRALGLSHLAADHDLTVYVLACKSNLAGDMHMAADAIGAAEQAVSLAPTNSRLSAVAATFAGRGYALSGDHAATELAYENAHDLLTASDADPASPCGSWLTPTYISLQRARSLTVLGSYRRAAESFEGAIGEMPAGIPRGRGVWLARSALAYAGDREVEHAATLGLDALSIGAETGSARILTELIRLDDALAPWQKTPVVADFRTAVRETISRQA
ncbi:MAG: helix-turn-helix domain-containing protein [Pseudonocardiaceae bacterium]